MIMAKNYLERKGFRVEIDNRVESLNKKIRQAEVKKIPYMIIIGKNEEKTGTITVRKKIGGDMKEIKLSDFTGELKDVIENKKKIY